MKQVRIKSGDGYFMFSFNGKSYVIPPKGLGGSWKPATKWKYDPVQKKHHNVIFAKKISDIPKRDWIDIPDHAQILLMRGDHQKRLREAGLQLEFIEDIKMAVDAERKELHEAKESMAGQIESQEAEIAALRAKLDAAKKRLQDVPAPKRKAPKKNTAPQAGA